MLLDILVVLHTCKATSVVTYVVGIIIRCIVFCHPMHAAIASRVVIVVVSWSDRRAGGTETLFKPAKYVQKGKRANRKPWAG